VEAATLSSRPHDVLAAREAEDMETEQGLVVEWQSRLRRLLTADPSLAGELRTWSAGSISRLWCRPAA
jgi:hypothetical protein